MKILQVNCVYKNGSTGKIVYDIHTELQKYGFQSVVCYGRGEKIDDPCVYKTCSESYSKFNNLLSRLTGMMYSCCFFSTRNLISIIKKEKPDLIHLHCINGYFLNISRLITFLRDAGIPTVLTLHAEFIHTANCGHALDCEKWKTGCGNCPRLYKETKSLLFDHTHNSWRKMKDAFVGFENLSIASVSPWLMNRAKQSPVLADKHHYVVLNGIDTNIFHPYETSNLRNNLGIENEKIVFHVTAEFSANPNHLKGGYYVLELAKHMRNLPVRFLVAGNFDHSFHWPDNVTFLGKISDQKLLAQYYSMADVTLLTSKRETFRMPVVESLCCGTPVVGFNAGGPESIALVGCTQFVPYGDLDTLFTAIMFWSRWKYENKSSAIAEQAIEVYSKRMMLKEYLTIYRKHIN